MLHEISFVSKQSNKSPSSHKNEHLLVDEHKRRIKIKIARERDCGSSKTIVFQIETK